jgi:hypothetical protein
LPSFFENKYMKKEDVFGVIIIPKESKSIGLRLIDSTHAISKQHTF